MKEWIFVLAASDAETLGTVRCVPGIQAALAGEKVWVRGLPAAEKLETSLRQLPVQQTYVLDNGYLFPEGKLTPVAQLDPALHWQPLTTFIPVEFPVSLLPAQLGEKHPIRLRASTQHREGYALQTDLQTWHTYAHTAPQIRLDQVTFAVAEDNQVLILGTPLLPLPGQEYWKHHHLLIPSGFDFDPPLLGEWLVTQLDKHSMIVFDTDGNWERISAECFVPATRSAVRLTYERRIPNG